MSTVTQVHQDLQTIQGYIQEGAKWCLAGAIGAFLSKFHFTRIAAERSRNLEDTAESVKILNTMPITLFTLSILFFLTDQALQAALKSDSLGLVERVG